MQQSPLVVVLSHAAGFTSLKIPIISGLGTEAVVVFFVLSGYVIAYVSNNKENNYAAFFKARAIRIYSVLVPAILITFFLDHIGLKYNPSYYFSHPNFYSDYSFFTFIKLVFFLGEGFNQHLVFGSNEPIWSIGFECIYYILFGALLFCRKKPILFLIFFIFIFISLPKVIIYFPLWLMGVFVYKISNINFKYSHFLFILTLPLFYLTIKLPLAHIPMYKPFVWSLHQFSSIIYFYLFSLVVSINILTAKAFFEYTGLKKILTSCEYYIRYLSGKTFTLYLMHLPVMMLICSLYYPKTIISSLFVVAITILITFFFSYLFENKRGILFTFGRYFSSKFLGVYKS
ncbi:acyltransferase family protein [Klebsiella michiganensis]|uniref:acyltransferase family protein n=1 Tax=Klebsiella michiganensis TaxID=1134687 RepID=UPI001CEF7CD8|nr:acyltransferase [Klebsiella michiganensis]MCY0171705.1 acyltransferase [Klebsiella michiganensis]MDS7811045.1 acyltransferase [Klebsiella michiganensis]MDS7850738.1 acyltransferase [Klebsiella michiganensis]MDS7923670.1 acyltransferase [Klebsiella michiganensis]